MPIPTARRAAPGLGVDFPSKRVGGRGSIADSQPTNGQGNSVPASGVALIGTVHLRCYAATVDILRLAVARCEARQGINGSPSVARQRRAKDGGPDRDRTGDLLNAIQARSQLRYRPIFSSFAEPKLTLQARERRLEHIIVTDPPSPGLRLPPASKRGPGLSPIGYTVDNRWGGAASRRAWCAFASHRASRSAAASGV